MKKIKKSVAVVAALLLMSSSSLVAKNAAVELALTSEADCHDQVYMTVVQADASGQFSEEEIAWISQAALAIYCYGYTLEEVIEAQQ